MLLLFLLLVSHRPERIWDYAVIPYEIDSNFSGVHKVNICILGIHGASCLSSFVTFNCCFFIDIFVNFEKSNFYDKFFKIYSTIKLPWDQVRSHKKFGPDRFCRFDVGWKQANRQTNSRIYIDALFECLKCVQFSFMKCYEKN